MVESFQRFHVRVWFQMRWNQSKQRRHLYGWSLVGMLWSRQIGCRSVKASSRWRRGSHPWNRYGILWLLWVKKLRRVKLGLSRFRTCSCGMWKFWPYGNSMKIKNINKVFKENTKDLLKTPSQILFNPSFSHLFSTNQTWGLGRGGTQFLVAGLPRLRRQWRRAITQQCAGSLTEGLRATAGSFEGSATWLAAGCCHKTSTYQKKLVRKPLVFGWFLDGF